MGANVIEKQDTFPLLQSGVRSLQIGAGNLMQSAQSVLQSGATLLESEAGIAKWVIVTKQDNTPQCHQNEWTPMFTQIDICNLRVELYNIMKWSSEGSNLFLLDLIYDAFALIGHAIFIIDYSI